MNIKASDVTPRGFLAGAYRVVSIAIGGTLLSIMGYFGDDIYQGFKSVASDIAGIKTELSYMRSDSVRFYDQLREHDIRIKKNENDIFMLRFKFKERFEE